MILAVDVLHGVLVSADLPGRRNELAGTRRDDDEQRGRNPRADSFVVEQSDRRLAARLEDDGRRLAAGAKHRACPRRRSGSRK